MVCGTAQQEFGLIYPQPGWVEHDPEEIWSSQQPAGVGAGDVAAVGITNQRETTVLWNRRTGEPVPTPSSGRIGARPPCAKRQRGCERLFTERTGLVLDPYLSGTKIRWLLDHVPDARQQAERGELAFGTVDSWLI
jgi:glycerol kinase